MPTPIEKLVLIEKITANIDNRYEAVRVMAKEARRLNSLIIRGAQADDDFKPTTAAVQRVIDNKVKYEYVERSEESGEMFSELDE
jgi:DNA-directed RNA polymerase subunit K/omega